MIQISTSPPRSHIRSSIPSFSQSLLQSSTSKWQSGRILAASAVSLSHGVRLASTSAPAASTATTAPVTGGPLDNAARAATNATEATTADLFDITSVTDNFANMPEHIGYLKEIGLDYGWGPTAMVEWALEHVHIWSGLPWWSSIAVTALGLRLVMAPLFLRSSDVGARMQSMQPIIKPLNARMMEAYKSSNVEAATKLRAELKSIYAAAGISQSAMFTPAIIQGIFGFCAFRLMRAMANLPVPGLETGGFLWLTDLTARDPYYILPAVMAASMHVVFRLGGESGAPMANEAMKPIMLYVLPSVIFVSTIWMPACLDIWLATAGLTGIVQVTAFRQPGVRRYFKMAPLPVYDPRHPNSNTQQQSWTNNNTAAPKPANTIDVKGSSRPFSNSAAAATGTYQAPSTPTGGAKFTPRSSAANTSATPHGSEPEQQQQDTRTFVERAKSNATSKINSIGDGFKTQMDQARVYADQLAGNKSQKGSKTRSKEFLRQAQQYEKEWQRKNKGRSS